MCQTVLGIAGVEHIADEMVRAFVDNRFCDVAKSYEFPTVVFHGPDIFVLSDLEDFIHRIGAYRALLREHGVSDIKSVVSDVQNDGPERCQFEVRNQYFVQDRIGFSESVIRYFLELRDGVPKIRMVEYLRTPFSSPSVVRPKTTHLH